MFFMKSVLELISQGEIFRRVFAVLLKIVGILAIIGGLLVSISLWAALFDAHEFPPFGAILGGFIFQLFLIVTTYMVVHTIFIRARNIADLSEGDFTMIPIVSIFCRLIGEVFAVVIGILSIGLGISMWLAGGYFTYFTRELDFIPFHLGGGGVFLAGLITIGAGLLYAFLLLVIYYFISELIIVFVDIARNTKAIRKDSEQHEK